MTAYSLIFALKFILLASPPVAALILPFYSIPAVWGLAIAVVTLPLLQFVPDARDYLPKGHPLRRPSELERRQSMARGVFLEDEDGDE